MQKDATIPNTVGPTMLGVVTSVLAVVCKRMQQLPTMSEPAMHRGKNTPTRLWRPFVIRVCVPNNVGRVVQTNPTSSSSAVMRYVPSADYTTRVRVRVMKDIIHRG